VLISLPAEMASAVIAPRIAELYSKGHIRELSSLLRKAAMLASLPSILILLFYLVGARLVLGSVYGPFYQGGAGALVVLGVGQLINVGTGLSGTTLIMTGHPRVLVVISALCTLLMVAMALSLVRQYGVPGVAFAAAMGTTVQTLAMLTIARKRIGIWTHVGWKQ
jgi:O-antigen/teichoic acid export membrane protein